MRLLVLAALAVVCWKLLTGRWPWRAPHRTGPGGESAIARARALLGVGATADRTQIVAAHRAALSRVHPDRGGSSEAVHAADAARDLLLADVAPHEDGGRVR